jgi:23S rRNA (adenine2030-N6)-methyltransferase
VKYRHKYHAGNFADVLKHATLARIVVSLKTKDEAFRVVDTHAGAGLYDLSSIEAQKSGEWRDGIQRLVAAAPPHPVAGLLAPYLDIVREMNPAGRIIRYPGSPKLVRALLRPQDRLSAIELHPEEADALKALFDGDYQTRVTTLDGWLALGAHLPPRERRGLVLVDPPFEEEGEFDRLVDGLARAYGRWQGGSYCLWYPVMAGAPIDVFQAKVKALGIRSILCAELRVCGEEETSGLSGSGLILINPPNTLELELRQFLPVLQNILGRSKLARHRLFWLTEEN